MKTSRHRRAVQLLKPSGTEFLPSCGSVALTKWLQPRGLTWLVNSSHQLLLSMIRKHREAKTMFLFVKFHPRRVFQTSRLTFHCRNLVLRPHVALRGSRKCTFQPRRVRSSGGCTVTGQRCTGLAARSGSELRSHWVAHSTAEQSRAWSDSQ